MVVIVKPAGWAVRFITPDQPFWYTVWRNRDGDTLEYVGDALLTLDQVIKLEEIGYECHPY